LKKPISKKCIYKLIKITAELRKRFVNLSDVDDRGTHEKFSRTTYILKIKIDAEKKCFFTLFFQFVTKIPFEVVTSLELQ